MMPGKRHFLCSFRKKTDANGKVYFVGRLANSRLLLFPTDEGELAFYLGGQIEVEKKSFYNARRDANGSAPNTRTGGK